MSSSCYTISLIKQSNMPKEQVAVFLLNVSKEALCDFLMEPRALNKPTNLKKTNWLKLLLMME